MLLAADARTDWRIVISHQAPPPEQRAAAELQFHLKAISGATLPIVTDTTPREPGEILVGTSNRTAGQEMDKAPGAEAFIIRTGPDHLLIAGEGRRGTLYGVYDFLERHLGCRWFTADVAHIPRRSRIEIGPLDERRAPAFEYREPYSYEAQDPDWAVRNKCNGHFPELGPERGGGLRYTPFVHSFDALVPVAQFFDTHPEYFSEVGGRRLRHETQLCLAHPEVFALALARIRGWLAENPGVSIVSVSQNDWENPCQCAACRAVDTEEGNYSGSLIRFVNRLAAAIEPEHPHVAIDTLAYQYTRKPPRVTRPRHNVIVRLCTIECCFSHPLESCGEKMLLKRSHGTGATFAEDLAAWARICDRLYVWDYVTNFANYVLPFPNLGVLGPNLRLFARNHVKGVFAQGANPPAGGGEFAALRSWVLARLMWAPAQDERALIAEFLHGVYGRGAPHLQRYLDALHERVTTHALHASIYDRPDSSYLTPELLAFAETCFDQAEEAADNPAGLARIQRARLPIRFARLAALPVGAPGREELITHFAQEVKAAGITQLSEHIPAEQTLHYLRQGIHLTHFARYDGGWSPFDNPWPVGERPPEAT